MTFHVNTCDTTLSTTGNQTLNEKCTYDLVLQNISWWRAAVSASPVSSSCFQACRTPGPAVQLGPCWASWCRPRHLHPGLRGQKYWKVKKTKIPPGTYPTLQRNARWQTTVAISHFSRCLSSIYGAKFPKKLHVDGTTHLSTSLLRHRYSPTHSARHSS